MTFGIEMRNTSGKTVISAASQNLSFHQKITATVPHYTDSTLNESNYLHVFNTSLTDSSAKPVVYYEPETRIEWDTPENSMNGYCPVRIYFESGVWKVACAINGLRTDDPSVPTFDVDIVLYVFVLKSPSQGWGIQTFNSDGSLAFDGGNQPLAISGIADIVRSSDTYTDNSQNGFVAWDFGSGSVAVPAGAQTSNYAISVPPFFYGADSSFATGPSSTSSSYALGCIVKNPNNPNLLESLYGVLGISFSSALSAPIWNNIRMSFIDGSIYS